MIENVQEMSTNVNSIEILNKFSANSVRIFRSFHDRFIVSSNNMRKIVRITLELSLISPKYL